MSSSPALPMSNATANLFEFATHSGKTKITYYPFAPGPLIKGQLLSVVLKPQVDIGSLTFSLFLPPVVLGTEKSQSFTTYGMKTQHAGNIQKPGAQIAYETERLSGDAKVVMLPL